MTAAARSRGRPWRLTAALAGLSGVLPGGPPARLAVSWGSAVGASKASAIYAAVVTFPATP